MAGELVRATLKSAFIAGVNAVRPHALIKNQVKIKNDLLLVNETSFQLTENVYVVGFGKAVMGMAIALEDLLGEGLQRGIVSVPKGSLSQIWDEKNLENFPKLTGKLKFVEAAENNQPNSKSLEVTREIVELLEPLTEKDTVIVVVSGGGSALLCMPKDELPFEEKQEFCKKLQNAGADISELNKVRIKLSKVKGGGLTRIAYPAKVISLILSDIIDDPIHLIASGPTVYSNQTSAEEITDIITKYKLSRSLTDAIKEILSREDEEETEGMLNESKDDFVNVTNLLIGNNTLAVEAAEGEVIKHKMTPIIIKTNVSGNVRDVAYSYAKLTDLVLLACQNYITHYDLFTVMDKDSIIPLDGQKIEEIYRAIKSNINGIVLILAGEPTVNVTGSGKGGRNQELALYFSMDCLVNVKKNPRNADYEVTMLSAGTDGQDGPTDAAGAFGYPALGAIIKDVESQLRSLILKDLAKGSVEDVQVEEAILDLCGRYETNPVNLSKPISPSVDRIDKAALAAACPADDVRKRVLMMQEVKRMMPKTALKNNNSYNFYSRFKRGSDLLKTGLTGTNVMDLQLICIRKRDSCEIVSEETENPNLLDHHDLLPLEMSESEEKIIGEAAEKLEQINVDVIDKSLMRSCKKSARED